MFMGIDFSHAPPQSLIDRKAGKAPAIPSVVGVSSFFLYLAFLNLPIRGNFESKRYFAFFCPGNEESLERNSVSL
jgi:hypothetical protein